MRTVISGQISTTNLQGEAFEACSRDAVDAQPKILLGIQAFPTLGVPYWGPYHKGVRLFGVYIGDPVFVFRVGFADVQLGMRHQRAGRALLVLHSAA